MNTTKAGKVYSCGLEAALDIVGGKWKPMILWGLSSGPRRFSDLRRCVVGISEKILIQHLRDLESVGIVNRKDFHEVPPHVEYSLTPFGDTLLRALGPLCDWGSEHMNRIRELKAEDPCVPAEVPQEAHARRQPQRASSARDPLEP